MMSSKRKMLLLALVALALLCVAFGLGFLLGGARSGFVLSYIGFTAVGILALATTLRRWQPWISAGALAGLVGPAIALVLIAGAEGGALRPDAELFRRLASLMAVLWYPGNWVSSLLGMETRLSDLDLSRRDELYEWIRLVPMNCLVYGVLALPARFLVSRVPFRGSRAASEG